MHVDIDEKKHHDDVNLEDNVWSDNENNENIFNDDKLLDLNLEMG